MLRTRMTTLAGWGFFLGGGGGHLLLFLLLLLFFVVVVVFWGGCFVVLRFFLFCFFVVVFSKKPFLVCSAFVDFYVSFRIAAYHVCPCLLSRTERPF